ncbi:hypothetical protein LUZ60_007595 [Juncus effusus]|nr:hypothetical protein LUZ60_007595 [Juncus effusus]
MASENSSCEAAAMELLSGLDGLVLETIVLMTGPKNAAALACASTRLNGAASADAVWKRFCADDFDLTEPVDPDGKPLPSFKEAYAEWFKSFNKYPAPVVTRAKSFWTSMKSYLAQNFTEAFQTLNKGLSESQIDLFESSLGFKLPVPTRVLYRFCNGQNTKAGTGSSNSNLFHFGLIGGYEFNNHFVNVHLLPLQEAISLTKRLSRDLDCLTNSKLVIIATSCNWRKLVFHDCAIGQLYIGTQNLVTDSEMLRCVPQGLVGQDGLLTWLEEHVKRLQSGVIGTRVFRGFKGISLYPEAGPLCSTAVTNGVKVRASAVLVPEGSTPGEPSTEDEDPDRYLYSYSIRLSLLPEGCRLDGKYHSSCQLAERHWLIKSRGYLVNDVNGEAVIGKYPLLTPGMDEFVYESAASLPNTPGSIEGSFTMVPGSLKKPEGRQFEATVAPFVLEDLNFVF